MLITGGAAVERERVARECHESSPLGRGPFVVVREDHDALLNAIMSRLGHAAPPTDDVLRRAEGGTLFVDDIHRVAPDAQRLFFEFLRRGRALRPADTGWAGRITVGTPVDLERLVTRDAFLAPLFDTLDKLRVDLGYSHPTGVRP